MGIAGPVGSGKTALVDRLSQRLYPRYNLAVVTNDIYTKEDAEFLLRQGTLPAERDARRGNGRVPACGDSRRRVDELAGDCRAGRYACRASN